MTDNEKRTIPFMNNSAIFRHNDDAMMSHHITKGDCYRTKRKKKAKAKWCNFDKRILL